MTRVKNLLLLWPRLGASISKVICTAGNVPRPPLPTPSTNTCCMLSIRAADWQATKVGDWIGQIC